jgi:hypothetical protein
MISATNDVELSVVRQPAFADASFEPYRKPTRPDRFLSETEPVVPWSQTSALVEPFHPKNERAVRSDDRS